MGRDGADGVRVYNVMCVLFGLEKKSCCCLEIVMHTMPATSSERLGAE